MIEIRCPKKDLDINSRIDILFENINDYIDSPAFKELVILFGGIDYTNMSFKDKIDYLSDFVKVWDYRNNRERWDIKNDEFIDKNKKIIEKLLIDLNLVYPRALENKPDYILVLGGARKSNLERPSKAKELYDVCGKKPIVVALSCDREIQDLERINDEFYDDSIKTEADALGKGIEVCFKTKINNKKGNVTEYDDGIYLISAIKNKSGKRANTYDTFQEFINIFNVKDKNILLVTTQPYTSYQLLKFIDFAFDNNLFIESIGCKGILLQESNYLQELKSNIDAIKVLSDKYLKEIKYERKNNRRYE